MYGVVCFVGVVVCKVFVDGFFIVSVGNLRVVFVRFLIIFLLLFLTESYLSRENGEMSRLRVLGLVGGDLCKDLCIELLVDNSG